MSFSIAIQQPKLGFNIKPSSTQNQNLSHLKPFKTPLSFLPKGPKFSPSVNLRIDDSNYARNINEISLKASSSTTDAIPTVCSGPRIVRWGGPRIVRRGGRRDKPNYYFFWEKNFFLGEKFRPPGWDKKLKVVVKSLGKPRPVLKFVWMQKEIGIALDKMIPGHGTILSSPYYFWPREDAWEELKVLLESKSWISPMQRVILLNQATDIINLWQKSGGNIS